MSKKKTFEWERDLQECHYESPADFLWFYVIHGCGCGLSETFGSDFWEVFERIAKADGFSSGNYDMLNNDKYKELIAQVLDSRGLLEHGTNIYGSWLNDSGKALYAALLKQPKSLDDDSHIKTIQVGMI